MSTLFVRTLREDPADAEVASHKLLVRGGYVRRVAPGIYSWLPLGLKVLARIERVIREEMDRAGSQEVHFPALLPREPYEATGRWEDYGPTLFKLRDRKDADYLLAPTHEEMFALLVKDLYSSYRDLPLSLYQIQTKYRDEARPRAGVIRGREFVMKDAYSFDIDEAGLDASYNAMREAYQRIFDRLGLPYVICSAVSGAMGGSRSEEFLFPCEIGEDTFVLSEGGYAANAEAVTTPPPAEADPSCVGEPFTVRTPGASTIEALVRDVNAAAPREDRPWRAQDTLKNVVVVAVQPDGAREVFVVGLPGDREVDLRRVEAALAPAEVDLAGPEDLAAYPELVPGYIGPQVLGPQSSRHRSGRSDCGRHDESDRSRHHDLDQDVGRRQARLDRGACRRIARRHPGVPGFIHGGKVADVGQVDRGAQQLALVAAQLGQHAVDGSQHLTGLVSRALAGVFRNLASQIGHVVVHHRFGHALAGFQTLDFHVIAPP